jgi:regulator of CtrA degradation
MRDIFQPGRPETADWKRRVAEFASTEVFDRLFKDGMGLVEQAAAYLDGPGREHSRHLSRDLALVYAAESMEVTTRLMQAASWLVVQRAVREADMTVEEAGDEKYRIAPPGNAHPMDRERLPADLCVLIDRSRALYDRVWRLDEALYTASVRPTENVVMQQIDRVRSAAEQGVFDPLAIWREK